MSDAHYPALGFLAHDDDVQKKNLDELDPSFMFTKVLKEILLELEYDNESMSELVKFCRGLFQENDQESVIIDDFEKNYSFEMAIWWYTRESFLYKMLNPALRTLDANTIIKMGFFLRDLHMQITRLHREQNTNDKHSKSFTVYRGQALTSRDFDQLKKANGGLMSFNNFLSTSLNHKIALEFAQGANSKIDHVGILFVMQIDSSNSSTPFARVTDVAYYTAEEETLFSMHSVFRINSIEKKNIDGKDLWQVNLILTDDDDQELQNLTERLREETQGSSGWDRMGKLLIKLGMFVSAEDTYNVLLKQTVTNIEKAHIYHQLGYIKEDLGQFNDALEFYEKSLDLKKKDPPSDNSHFAIYYNNIGSVYDKKGDYSIAVSFFKKAIEIFQEILHPNHPRLATCYNNIGSANHNMCAYSTALFYYEKAIEIDEQCLPLNDPSLGIDYNNKGLVYYDMKEYDQALSCFQQTLDIYKKSLQPDHTYFSNIYSNFGTLYNSMENYSEALLYYQKALEIDQKALPGNHPSLGISYNNIGSVYKNMAEYSQALSMFECAFDIENSAQSPNPSHLQSYINNIEFVKEKLQEMHS
jgi:tetratricopeptide (TPR) repeat protein